MTRVACCIYLPDYYNVVYDRSQRSFPSQLAQNASPCSSFHPRYYSAGSLQVHHSLFEGVELTVARSLSQAHS